MRGWQAANRVAVRPVIAPHVLLSRKLNYLDLADKTRWLLRAGNFELYIELRRALGMLVNCKQSPLLIRSSHGVGSDRG